MSIQLPADYPVIVDAIQKLVDDKALKQEDVQELYDQVVNDYEEHGDCPSEAESWDVYMIYDACGFEPEED